MRDDFELQREVMNELKWEPGIKPERIGVHVDDGVIHLAGEVDSYPQKTAVERAVKRVPGVVAIADEIKIRLPDEYERTDEELARLAGSALEWSVSVPHDDVKVIVRDGWVTLDGEVGQWYQKVAAEEAVKNLVGVKGVTNGIRVKPSPAPSDIKTQIERAMVRIARLDARKISVETIDGKVILRGKVHTWQERDEAERAACNAPGISEIDNQIRVESG